MPLSGSGQTLDTFQIISQILGGLGLFLLGMIIMTDGLHALAGKALRSILMRFTRSPLTGAIAGTVSTALLQSSSAITVAAIGFVGAGLLGFPESLGIVLGASVGTTITGWLVTFLGLKLHIGIVLFPLLFIGAILRLFTKGRTATIGYTLAGFCLIFAGIEFMQQGMAGLEGVITPDHLPSGTFFGRIELVLIGALATVITQSSSAGVATTLTALYAGAIQFEQAAALVIGMNIGTTATAVIATLGASTGARRTGYSHVIFNIVASMGAFILIDPYILLWKSLSPGALAANAEVALVAFHSLFNVLALMIVLPFTMNLARFMTRIIPAQAGYAENLDLALLQQPAIALSNVQLALLAEFQNLLKHIQFVLSQYHLGKAVQLNELQSALDETQNFIDRIHLPRSTGDDWKRLLASIHALDHLRRLQHRCEREENRAITAREESDLAQLSQQFVHELDELLLAMQNGQWPEAYRIVEQLSTAVMQQTEQYRETLMQKIATGDIDVPNGTDYLEAVRWLQRVSIHIERIVKHLGEVAALPPIAPGPPSG